MQVTLVQAIQQLREDLRQAVIEGRDQDIVFTPRGVELELSVTFDTEAKADGGFKLVTFVNLSAGTKVSDSTQHKIKLTLDVADRQGNRIEVGSAEVPANRR